MVPEYIRHVPPRMYAKACVYGDLIFLAGEDGKDEATEEVVGDTAAQTEKTFVNMKATLESLGSGLEHVIKTTVYLKDPRDRNAYGPVRGKYLPHMPPSTLIMGVDLAEPEMLVEIDAIAIIPGSGR